MQPAEERVVVLAPSARDGPITASLLSKEGFACVLVRDVPELCAAVREGAAVALLAQEALAPASTRTFAELLDQQEPWSDLPVVIFTVRERPAAHGFIATLAASGNVTLLERPVATITLVSAVRAALRARRRQYAARAVLAELQAVLDAVPAAVLITRDRDARTMEGNRFCTETLRMAPRVNVSTSAPPGEAPQSFRVVRNGVEVPPEELPVQLAGRTRREIRDHEFELLFADGEIRHMYGNAAPLMGPDGVPRGAVGAFLDITARKQAEKELRHALDRLERQVRLFDGVASTTPDFVYLFDLQGRFLYANRRLLEVWGMELPDVIGKTCRELGYEQWHHDMHMREIAQVIETKRPIKGEVPFTAPLTGTFGVYEYIFTPVLGPDGQVEIVAGTTRDVSERKQSEEALREADRRKDQFLSMLSHELRNPLAAIRNSIRLLHQAGPDSEHARRAQGIIGRQTEHLTRLVEDLLDVTRIARGKIDLRRERLDLRELILRAADDFRPLIDERGVAFHVAVPARRTWVDADATRVLQVIGNLLHNAAKFTSRGDDVTLSLSTADDHAEISVRDTGSGVDPSLLPKVFDAFVQGEHTIARTEGGLGLGLALVKGIIELHGGTVRADSAGRGHGAEFVVRLPLAPALEREVEPPPRPARTNGRRRVLLVDDNRDAALSLAELLRLVGHTIDVAFDGPSAIEMARINPPDAVVCDIGLPGMSGYDVVRALRDLGRPVKIVALTGYAQPEDIKAAIDAGFDAHVAKPCDPDDVERLIG